MIHHYSPQNNYPPFKIIHTPSKEKKLTPREQYIVEKNNKDLDEMKKDLSGMMDLLKARRGIKDEPGAASRQMRYSPEGKEYSKAYFISRSKGTESEYYNEAFEKILKDENTTYDEKVLAQVGKRLKQTPDMGARDPFYSKQLIRAQGVIMKTLANSVPGPMGKIVMKTILEATEEIYTIIDKNREINTKDIKYLKGYDRVKKEDLEALIDKLDFHKRYVLGQPLSGRELAKELKELHFSEKDRKAILSRTDNSRYSVDFPMKDRMLLDGLRGVLYSPGVSVDEKDMISPGLREYDDRYYHCFPRNEVKKFDAYLHLEKMTRHLINRYPKGKEDEQIKAPPRTNYLETLVKGDVDWQKNYIDVMKDEGLLD